MGHSMHMSPSAICKGENRQWTHCRRAVDADQAVADDCDYGFDSRPRKRVIAITVGCRVLVNPTEDKHGSCWMTITRARAST